MMNPLRLMPVKTWFILAAVVVAIILTVSYCQARTDARLANASARVAEGQAKASDAATVAVADYADRQTDRANIERDNRDEILSAPNASDSAGAAGDAGLRVLCERPAYRSDPVCLRLKSSAAVSR